MNNGELTRNVALIVSHDGRILLRFTTDLAWKRR